jgi:hypothetical protein
MEQEVCIKFCQNLGKTYTDTYSMNQVAFMDDSISCTQVFEWFLNFKEA